MLCFVELIYLIPSPNSIYFFGLIIQEYRSRDKLLFFPFIFLNMLLAFTLHLVLVYLVYDMLYFNIIYIYRNNNIKTHKMQEGKHTTAVFFPFRRRRNRGFFLIRHCPYGLFRLPWDQEYWKGFPKVRNYKPKKADGTNNNLGRILRCEFKIGFKKGFRA